MIHKEVIIRSIGTGNYSVICFCGELAVMAGSVEIGSQKAELHIFEKHRDETVIVRKRL